MKFGKSLLLLTCIKYWIEEILVLFYFKRGKFSRGQEEVTDKDFIAAFHCVSSRAEPKLSVVTLFKKNKNTLPYFFSLVNLLLDQVISITEMS